MTPELGFVLFLFTLVSVAVGATKLVERADRKKKESENRWAEMRARKEANYPSELDRYLAWKPHHQSSMEDDDAVYPDYWGEDEDDNLA